MTELITKPIMQAAQISIVAQAHLMKKDALHTARSVETVDDLFEAQFAANAQKTLKSIINAMEESRKQAKTPILETGRNIDNIAKEFVADVIVEEQRIAKLLGAYQRVERDKKVAAQREAMIEENKIMIEQAHKAAESGDLTQSIDEDALTKIAKLRDNIAEQHDAVEGVKVRTTTKFEVIDEIQLQFHHPELFSPDHKKIREALKTNKNIQGIKTWEETKAY